MTSWKPKNSLPANADAALAATDTSYRPAHAFVRIAPFALYIGMMAVTPSLVALLGASKMYLYLAQIALTTMALLYWRRRYEELAAWRDLRFVDIAASLLVGVAVFVAWIHLDASWMTLGKQTAVNPWDAAGDTNSLHIALRLLGSTLVVPVMEELFWRSFIMRWIDDRHFLRVQPHMVTMRACFIAALLFAFEHTLWFAGIVAGVAYALLYMRSRNLWTAIIAHGVTNGLLGAWVIATDSWQFW